MATYPTRLRKWTRAEYERLIEIGVFRPGEPVELLGGELMVSEPQGSAHYTAIGLMEDALRAALGPGWLVRSQGPIALAQASEPEPDVAITRGSRRDYSREHPARPALVGEVAESSLSLDGSTREASTREPASPTLDLNLVERVLEIYREPILDPATQFGWRYASLEILAPGASAAPLAAPAARIPVPTSCRSRRPEAHRPRAPDVVGADDRILGSQRSAPRGGLRHDDAVEGIAN